MNKSFANDISNLVRLWYCSNELLGEIDLLLEENIIVAGPFLNILVEMNRIVRERRFSFCCNRSSFVVWIGQFEMKWTNTRCKNTCSSFVSECYDWYELESFANDWFSVWRSFRFVVKVWKHKMNRILDKMILVVCSLLRVSIATN